jgi:hypothetical protein
MAHFVSIDDVVRNPNLDPQRGQFINERPPDRPTARPCLHTRVC